MTLWVNARQFDQNFDKLQHRFLSESYVKTKIRVNVVYALILFISPRHFQVSFVANTHPDLNNILIQFLQYGLVSKKQCWNRINILMKVGLLTEIDFINLLLSVNESIDC
jgi:hypothetical protein